MGRAYQMKVTSFMLLHFPIVQIKQTLPLQTICVQPDFSEPLSFELMSTLRASAGSVVTCSAGEVRRVLPSVAAVEPSSSLAPGLAVVSEKLAS